MIGIAKLSDYLDRLAAATMDSMGLPGMAIAVTDSRQTVLSAGYGVADLTTRAPVSDATLFEIGSLGKPFTVVALLQLYEAGAIDLHTPISHYLPWFEVQSDHSPITVHHLLNHTGGLPRGTDISPHGLYESWELRYRKAGAPPGAFFWYSNIGYKTLGFIVEQITGRNLPDVIRENILEPLGMTETRPAITFATRGQTATGYTSIYDDRPDYICHPLTPAVWAEFATGDGAQVSTVGDMAAYARALLNRGQGPNRRLIAAESFNLMTATGVWTGGDFYGYGLAYYSVDSRRYIGHGGGNAGFRSAMIVDLAAGLGVVLLTNRTGETDPLVEVAQAALTAVRAADHGQDLPSPPERNDPTSVPNADAYSGEYRCNNRTLSIVAGSGRLRLLSGDDSVLLEQRSRDCFYVPHPDFALFLLEFERRDGTVVAAGHGPHWYVNDRYSGPVSFDYPPHWDIYAGHYRARNPELSNFRVGVRKGTLTLFNPWGNTQPLVPLGEADSRIGLEEQSPETLSFSAIANGRALRADYSGCPYYRAFNP